MPEGGSFDGMILCCAGDSPIEIGLRGLGIRNIQDFTGFDCYPGSTGAQQYNLMTEEWVFDASTCSSPSCTIGTESVPTLSSMYQDCPTGSYTGAFSRIKSVRGTRLVRVA